MNIHLLKQKTDLSFIQWNEIVESSNMTNIIIQASEEINSQSIQASNNIFRNDLIVIIKKMI